MKKQEWERFKEAAKKAIEHHGGRVGMHSPECVSYRKGIQNCKGCASERDCSKYTKIQLLALCQNPDQTIIDKLLDASTVEEVNAIRVNITR